MTRKEEITIVLLFGISFVLFLVKVMVANYVVTGGSQYVELSDEVTKIKTQNDLLKNEILQYESLGYINQKARQMGMARSKALYIYK